MEIELKDIEVVRRDRKDFGNIDQLYESIKRVGLIHPIVVSDQVEDTTKYKYRLVAGERRTRACILLGWTKVPAVMREELDEFQTKEIELEENIARKDLSWIEECEAKRVLDELKRHIYGSKTQGEEGEGWTLGDTAKSLGENIGQTSRDIQLATKLKENPELAKQVAKLPKTAAFKVVKQMEKAAKAARMLANNEITISDIDLRNVDCTVGIKEIADNSVDLVITDPPFAVDKIYNATAEDYNATGARSNVSDEETMMNVYRKLFPELYRVLKPSSHIYVFFGPSWFTELKQLMEAAGFEVYDCPLIWNKMRSTIKFRGYNYMRSYVMIFYGYKPPRDKMLTGPMNDLLDAQAVNPQSKIHPLQMPEEIFSKLLIQSSQPGDVVLDPFSGSAISLIAARKLQRNAIGFEMDKDNYLRSLQFIQEQLK